MDNTVAIRMVHVFKVNNDVVLRSHVICDVVIDNQTEESIQECQVDFLVDFFKAGFKQYNRLTVGSIPNTLQVIYALAPLVHEQWWRF